MNSDELIVKQYLESCGYKSIIYEPDGNVPPDFLINDCIAIEVRKLNQHFNNNGKNEPLEKVEYKLIPMLETLLKKFEGENHEYSSFISIQYSRPVGNIKQRIKEIEKVLINHLPIITEDRIYPISETIEIRVFPSPERFESPYVLGIMPDMDAGGFVVSEIYSNLQIVLAEKTKKISKYRENYKEWWLILVDHIGFGLCERDAKQLQDLSTITEDWDKVILVSPTKHDCGIEI